MLNQGDTLHLNYILKMEKLDHFCTQKSCYKGPTDMQKHVKSTEICSKGFTMK